jgi:1-deoxy-D-xylulose-5-phosphate reductoisomerase
MPDPKRIVLLGATGSIGESTLAVIERHPARFELVGIAANQNGAALDAIGKRFNVPNRSLYSTDGVDGLRQLATLPEADLVIVATTGTIALAPTIAALEAGKTVGLANKETLVLGGEFVMRAAREGTGQLLPVDSEHNAIFQCLEALREPGDLKRILLTASGGPFIHHTRREMESITPAEALKHPNWDMGPKVTVDSATMANKGLEMIEARWLFDLAPDQIDVVIHPQSLIHSMVEFRDGSVLAQMAPASMTFPIQHVLAWPDKIEPCVEGLDFTKILKLELRPPDLEKFPCLALARQSLEQGGIAPAVYNAANEVAVEAFLQNQLGFLAIPKLIEHCLKTASFGIPGSLEELLQLGEDLLAFAQAELQNLPD